MGTGLHLGLVAARSSLPGQAACLASLGHTLVPGRDGLAAVVTAHDHLVIRDEVNDTHNDDDTDLLKRLAVTSGIGQGNVKLRPDREHAPLVQQGPVTLYPGGHLRKMRVKSKVVKSHYKGL